MGIQPQFESQGVLDCQTIPLDMTHVVLRLIRFREYLEHWMAPEPWILVEAPMVVLISDICDVLGLTGEEKAEILGSNGQMTIKVIQESRINIIPLNERQMKALHYLSKTERITNGEYQQLCPYVSTETLRLDLADLVARGLLEKHGRCRGTYYTTTA